MLRLTCILLISLLHRSALAQHSSPERMPRSNRIVVDAKELSLLERPLHNFKDTRNALNFDIENFHTPSHVAAWEIRNNALYLTDLSGTVDGKPFDPKTAFGKQLPVFADWYSGKLTIVEKPQEANYAPNAQPKFVQADVYLVSHGRVIYMRRLRGMACGLPPGALGFTLKKEDDHFIAIPKASKMSEMIFANGLNSNGVMSGDIVHGLIDHNGISLEFAGENEEVANATLDGIRGSEVTFIVSSPVMPKKTRVATVERK